jgi:hypothetical protein
MVGDRGAGAGDEGGADRHPHRAAHEGEILDAEHQSVPLDRAAGIDQRVGLAGPGPRRLQPVGIALGIAELERVLLHLRRRQDRVAGIEQHLEALRRPDPPMMLAARADEEILLIFLGEDHRLAFGAFVPEIVRRLALRQERDRIANLGQPAHVLLLGGRDRRRAGPCP